jgi:outer membrane immunogenic protein
MKMKKYLLGGLAMLAVAVSAPASAADMAVKAMPVKAPIIPVWNWTGFYVGANVGYSWGNWANNGLASTSTPRVNGVLGGLQAGYNWQLNSTWVVGLEGDIQITGQKASEGAGGLTTTDVLGAAAFPGGGPGAGFHTITTTSAANDWKNPWFGTFRGRVGALIDPTTLVYGTGGLAFGNFKMSSTATSVASGFRGAIGTTTGQIGTTTTTVGAAQSDSTTRLGWALGAGIEKKFTPNWSAKLEYLYLDYGTRTFLTGTGLDTSVRLRDHIVRVGLNYQFK